MKQITIPYDNKQMQFNIDNNDVWLSQKEIAELFGKDVRTVNRHIVNVLKDGELDESVISKYEITAEDGKSYKVNHYNLDMIIAVGYRVNSTQGTKFRKWATSVLSTYIREGGVVQESRVDEYATKMRAIRTSEQTYAKKINAIFATSSDYNPKSPEAQQFFATVTNKLHYATHGHTSAELIVDRANATSENMGLVTFKGNTVTLADAKIAKNYMSEIELRKMALLAEQFLLFSEHLELDGRTLTMVQWIEKLNAFIRVNDKLVLQSKGIVSRREMETTVKQVYQTYKQRLL